MNKRENNRLKTLVITTVILLALSTASHASLKSLGLLSKISQVAKSLKQIREIHKYSPTDNVTTDSKTIRPTFTLHPTNYLERLEDLGERARRIQERYRRYEK